LNEIAFYQIVALAYTQIHYYLDRNKTILIISHTSGFSTLLSTEYTYYYPEKTTGSTQCDNPTFDSAFDEA
jgi:hypothetical protein